MVLGDILIALQGLLVRYCSRAGVSARSLKYQEILHQLPVLGGTRRKLLSAEDVVGAVAPSSDGRKIAFSRYNAASGMSSLMIANDDGSGLSALATGLPAALGAGPISWSPDGKMIAELFRTGPVFVPANGGASRTMSLPGWKLIQNVAWLPSGKGLLVTAERDTAGVTAHHHVLEVSYPEGRVRRVTNDLSDHPNLRVTADAPTIAVVDLVNSSSIWIAPASDSDKAQRLNGGRTDGFRGAAWTSDGRIVYTDEAGLGWVMKADGSGSRPFSIDEHAVYSPMLCGHGPSMTFVGGRNDLGVICGRS
jgi:hypothetical protein